MGVCFTPQGCLAEAATSILAQLADSFAQAAGQMVTTLFGWWTATSSTSVDSAVAHTAQRFVTSWIALPVAVIALISVVGWGVVAGGDTWLRDVVRGLLVFGIAAAGSIPIVASLQSWSESLAHGLLAAVPTRDVGNRFLGMLQIQDAGPTLMIFWASLMLLTGAVQYLLMLFRDGAVVLLTVLIPTAAAGQFSRGSVLWLPKIAGWLCAFIFLKPAAALIYFVGLSMLGQATGLQALASGICLMVAAILALPALLRLVTFAVDSAPIHTNALAAASTVAGVAASGAQLLARRGASGAGPGGAGGGGTGGVGGGTGLPNGTVTGVVLGAGQAVTGAASNLSKTALQTHDQSATRPPGGTK